MPHPLTKLRYAKENKTKLKGQFGHFFKFTTGPEDPQFAFQQKPERNSFSELRHKTQH